MKPPNGFLLAESLLSLMVLGVCTFLLLACAASLHKSQSGTIDQKLETVWYAK